MLKNIIFTLLGVIATIIILQVIKKKSPESLSLDKFKTLVKTNEVGELVQTPEFTQVLKTPEFKDFFKTFSKEQTQIFLKTLV